MEKTETKVEQAPVVEDVVEERVESPVAEQKAVEEQVASEETPREEETPESPKSVHSEAGSDTKSEKSPEDPTMSKEAPSPMKAVNSDVSATASPEEEPATEAREQTDAPEGAESESRENPIVSATGLLCGCI